MMYVIPKNRTERQYFLLVIASVSEAIQTKRKMDCFGANAPRNDEKSRLTPASLPASDRQSGQTDNVNHADPARPPGGTARRTPAFPRARCRKWSRRTARHGFALRPSAELPGPPRNRGSSR